MKDHISRREFMHVSASGVAGMAIGSKALAMGAGSDRKVGRAKGNKKMPNVLFIISDQHNAKFLSCKGHSDVKTPNLDQLAKEGVRFDNAICQNPICTPSRVSYISGQYCHNHGYYGLSGPRPMGLPTIFGHFRQAGYVTGAIGKIHCPAYWVENDTDHFKEVYAGCSIGNKSAYADYLKKKGLLELRDDGMYPEQKGIQDWTSKDGRVSSLKYEDSVEGWVAAESIRFMKRESKGNRPFFLEMSLPRPHQIYCPSEPFWSMYDESKISLPPNVDHDLTGKPPHMKKAAKWYRSDKWTLFEPRSYKAGRLRKMHGYLGCVSQIDHAIGQVVDWLDANGLSENTIVIYGSDHGDYGCEFGMMEKIPGISSDAVTRIPFIWRWKAHFKAGHVAKEIVEAVDMSTTLCSLTGVETFETSEGKDLKPLLEGEHKELHKIGVTEAPWSKSVRKGKFRLVRYTENMFSKQEYGDDGYEGAFGELYDLEADPWEMKNLYFDPKYADVVAEMNNDLLEWLITTTRPATVHPPVRAEGKQWRTEYDHSVNPDGKISPDKLRKNKDRYYF
ncbi:sulfatase [Planctomycetota bacterium]